MQRFENNPLVKFATNRPRLAAWIVLAAGMVAILTVEAWDVGLAATQWVALITATVLVAGACVWIISWEDEEETDSADTPANMPPVEKKQDAP
ncbi:MAG: hypothetical protein ACOYL5_02305 [Phototrophicaceae bacterium]|jgi:hypothetical protein